MVGICLPLSWPVVPRETMWGRWAPLALGTSCRISVVGFREFSLLARRAEPAAPQDRRTRIGPFLLPKHIRPFNAATHPDWDMNGPDVSSILFHVEHATVLDCGRPRTAPPSANRLEWSPFRHSGPG